MERKPLIKFWKIVARNLSGGRENDNEVLLSKHRNDESPGDNSALLYIFLNFKIENLTRLTFVGFCPSVMIAKRNFDT